MTRRYFKLVFIVIISLLLPFYQLGIAHAIDSPLSPTIVINEIQANGIGTGTTAQEFVELKNISSLSVDLSGWKVQYISSTGNLATAKTFVTIPDSTVLYPGGYLLVTPDTYLLTTIPKLTYVINSSFSGIAATGGSIALMNAIGVNVDLVGWGTKTTTLCETALATAPEDGSSIQRKIIDGVTQDTDNNLLDFEPLATPTPQTDNPTTDPPPADTPPVDTTPDTPPADSSTDPNPANTSNTDTPPVDQTSNQPTTSDTVTTSPENPDTSTYQAILLNELFIDPITPLTDANDEWVELYNPNDTSQNLAGYTVYAGSTYAYHHTFTANDTIDAHGYFVITSGGTSIALSNGGGGAKIVGPTGIQYDATSYVTAPENTAWAKAADGTWQWTVTATEGTENIITPPSVAVALISSAAKKTTTTTKKTATTTKAATTKAAASKTTAKTTKVLAATDTQADAQLVAAPTPLPIWLLAVLGVLAVLYSGYEYRFDIANKIYQFRSH